VRLRTDLFGAARRPGSGKGLVTFVKIVGGGLRAAQLRKVSSSFLKKRTKKLLILKEMRWIRTLSAG
jgi:hypothetical protein